MESTPEFLAALPKLRRYARVLTGSQFTGDRLINLAQDNLNQLKNESPRNAIIGFFRLLSTIWRCRADTLSHQVGPAQAGGRSPQMRAPSLVGISRQVFLLSSLENFKMNEVAEILEMTTEACAECLEHAQQELTEQLNANVLIVEDDFFIAEDLKVILGQMGHRVSHVARTRADALVSAQQFEPDLLICDINLADGSSGISAAHAILQTQDIPVLFVTSNPKRLLTGDALEPTFVIEKPYLPAQIRAMVSQVLFFQESQRDCFVDVAI